jgi:hypothetical protein
VVGKKGLMTGEDYGRIHLKVIILLLDILLKFTEAKGSCFFYGGPMDQLIAMGQHSFAEEP